MEENLAPPGREPVRFTYINTESALKVVLKFCVSRNVEWFDTV